MAAFFKKQNPIGCTMCCHANIINETTRKTTLADTHYIPTPQLTHSVDADIFNPAAALQEAASLMMYRCGK